MEASLTDSIFGCFLPLLIFISTKENKKKDDCRTKKSIINRGSLLPRFRLRKSSNVFVLLIYHNLLGTIGTVAKIFTTCKLLQFIAFVIKLTFNTTFLTSLKGLTSENIP